MNSDPLLRYRYAEGLGDIVACTLHSKYIQPITSFLAKKEKTCAACQNRRNALNILFPIKFWKLFFKNQDEMLEDLDSEFKKIKLYWQMNTADGNSIPMKYSDIRRHLDYKDKDPIPTQVQLEEIPDFVIVNKSDTSVGDFVIRNIVFKRL